MVLHLSFVSDEVTDVDEEMLVFPVHFRIFSRPNALKTVMDSSTG